MQPWQPLLDWWFGPGVTAAEVAASRTALWFAKQDQQDDQAREQFAGLVEQALAGQLQGWPREPAGLAGDLAVAGPAAAHDLSQHPACLCRRLAGSPVALHGLTSGLGSADCPIQRVFVYLVLEHAEDLALQNQAVQLFSALHQQAATASANCLPATWIMPSATSG